MAAGRAWGWDRGVLTLIVSLGILWAGTPVDAAADEGESTDDAITWSVRPAGESEADGRSWVEQTLDPGDSRGEHMAVTNLSDVDVTFRLSAADGLFRDNGRFAMLESGEESVGAGTWIDLDDEVAVGAGETAIVPFTTTVPANATPGDHAAGVAASILSRSTGDDGATVGVESRVGFRVMTRVTGELSPGVAVTDVASSYDVSWNPVSPGAAEVTFEVENSGNTRLVVTGAADAAGRQVAFPGEGEIDQELLPGDRRTFTVRVGDVWPWFFVPATLEVTPDAVGAGEGTPVDAVRVDAGVWAIPWPQLIALAGVALIIGSAVWGRVRSRRRLARLLDEARAEGRREASGS
ncbi:DUF916 domain-containing protein [Myceligenerans halotolerans]